MNKFVITALSTILLSPALAEPGDAARGERDFRVCAPCHSLEPDHNMTGPSLAKIWQRRAGAVEGFPRYSEAMKHVDLVWNEEALDRWLTNPDKLIPGTSMTFPGLRESKGRHDVIAYLKAVSEGNAPAKESRGGGMMMNMQPAKEDLKKAPLQGQVTAISHCGDTYTIKTAATFIRLECADQK